MKQTITLILTSALLLAMASISLAENRQQEAQDRDSAKKGLGMAKISVVDAIPAALKKVPGGKAVQANLQVDNGQPRFEVEVIDSNGKHQTVNVDAISGTAGQVTAENAGQTSNEKSEDAASKASVTLVQAIEAAQKRVPEGKAFMASSEMDNGQPEFSIEFLSGNKTMKAQVDCKSGNVTNVKEAT